MTETEWLNLFAINLDSWLKYTNMTQRDLADAVGLSEATISKYLSKQQMPSVKAVVNMSHVFAVDLDEFIDFGSMIM